jgi:chorismate synthase
VLRYLTAGEFARQGARVIVEGLPAGLAVTVEDIQASWPGAARLRARAAGSASRSTS